MTPRSLVGMTMGARKRRALSAQEDDALSRLMRDPLKVLCGHFDAHDNAEQYRKSYRIGQRLRPCPGNGCRLGQSWCLRCDGTGVVSAKPKKVRR